MLLATPMRTCTLALVLVWATAVARAEADRVGLQPLREARERAAVAQARLAAEQVALEQALTTINQAVAARKAMGQEVADATLEELLRRHREISQRLTDLSREVRAASNNALQATQALVDAIDREVGRLRRLARGSQPRARAARKEIKRLLAERARFALGPVGGGCVLPEVQISPADGPEEARAKANLLRDAEDRCRRRIEQVEKRLAKVQDERKLLREAADFREEGQIFDEESRRRTQTRMTAETGKTPAATDGRDPAMTNPPGSGNVGGYSGWPPGPVPNDSVPSTPESGSTVREFRQPQVDITLGARRDATLEEEMEDLGRLRRNLRSAAERIRKAYESLVERARSLDKR
jgi:hypothetical protein